MNLEGNMFGSVFASVLIISFILLIVYIGGNRVYKEEHMKWLNNPIVVVLIWLLAMVLTTLRYYYDW